MNASRALLIGSAIIGAAIVISRLVAPYQISAVKGADNNPMVFRANTTTGDVKFCVIAPDPSGKLQVNCR